MARASYLSLLLLLPPALPSSMPSCTSPGYQADPSSCSAFLRCTGPGQGHRYLCPAGTRYDPEISNCNHAALAPPCLLELPSPTFTSPSPAPTAAPTPPPPPATVATIAPTSPPLATGSPPTPSHEEGEDADLSEGEGGVEGDSDEGTEDVLGEDGEGGSSLVGSDVGSVGTSEEDGGESPGDGGGEGGDGQYSVAPGSAYPCPDPGYFTLAGSCSEFWVCREVAPGQLSAERPFRCPARYLFDPVTRLCQREGKVSCSPSLYYSLAHSLAITLREDQLDTFFSSPLTLPDTKAAALPSSPHQLPTLPHLPLLHHHLHLPPHHLPLFAPRPRSPFYWLVQ